MSRCPVFFALLFAVVAACVPATEEREPRGALLIVTEPSAGSRGEAFVTADGWTVRVDTLLLQVYAVGASIDPAKRQSGDVFGKPSGDALISAARPAELLSYGIPAGPADAELVFALHSIARDDTINSVEGIDPALAARFKKHPDVLFQFEPPEGVPKDTITVENYAGPSFLAIVRGEKDGRSVKLDVALQDELGLGGGRRSNPTAVVVANTFVKIRVGVVAENLFVKDVDEGRAMLFGDYAAADVDGDGIITPIELDTARESTPCTGFCTMEEEDKGATMAKVLAKRVTQVFMQAP